MSGVGTPFLYAAAIIMIMVAAGLVYALVSGNRRKIPEGPVQWMGTILACLVVLSGIWLIVLASGAENIPVPRRGAVASPDQIEDMDISTAARDFSFKLVDSGKTARLLDHKGKVMIVNMWATWCAPCLYEIPDLNRIQRDYADSGVVVISLSDEDRRDLQQFSASNRLETVSGYVEEPALMPELMRTGFDIRPTSYIIDRDGTIRKYILGARNYRYFEKAIASYL